MAGEYKIATSFSTKELQAVVNNYTGNDAWTPVGGVSWDPQNQQFLQVLFKPGPKRKPAIKGTDHVFKG